MPQEKKAVGKKAAKKKVPTTIPTAPRGMRDIFSNEYFVYQGFFEKAAEIALYYGFKPIETPILEKEEVFSRSIGIDTDIVSKEMYTLSTRGKDRLALRPEGTAGIMRAYIEHGLHSLPQPVMLYYHGPFFRHERPQRGRGRQFWQFGFEMLGAENSITDALVIRLTHLILEEVGIKNLCVLINSMGDKNCKPNYVTELTDYYRKHINKLCAHCRMRVKKNPLRLLDCKNENCQEFKQDAPEIVSFLCEPCKRHLTEVLEYLETMEMPYRIDHTLVRGIDYYTRTVFEIISETQQEKEEDKKKDDINENSKKDADKDKKESKNAEEVISLAGGGRYNELAQALRSKRAVPAVGAAIGVERTISAPGFSSPTPRVVKKAKVYFIQVGAVAKLKSLTVIEVLRKAHIPIAHAISKNKLSAQLGMAERTGIPNVLILGQKEANENSIIIRNMKTRSQETVSIEKLGEYLKRRA